MSYPSHSPPAAIWLDAQHMPYDITWPWTCGSLLSRVSSVASFYFPNTLSKRWICTHFASEENWGSERTGGHPKLNQLGWRKGKILTQARSALWWADKRTCDASTRELRQQIHFPLSGLSGLPQDDKASPPEILSRYRWNCNFLQVKKWSNISISLWFNLKQSMSRKTCIYRKFCHSKRKRSCNEV